MTRSKYLEIVDPSRGIFSKDLPFVLSPKQVDLIKQGKLVQGLCTGLDLRVYNAFRIPNNLKKLYEATNE